LKSVYGESKAHTKDLVRTDRTFTGRNMPEDFKCFKPNIKQFQMKNSKET
jgi:hypothetical protein